MKSHKNAKETRKTNTSNEAKYAIWISIISLIISSAISLYTFSETNRVSEQLLQYQLEQERLPRIMALNYKFPVNILKVNDNGWYGIDSDRFDGTEEFISGKEGVRFFKIKVFKRWHSYECHLYIYY